MTFIVFLIAMSLLAVALSPSDWFHRRSAPGLPSRPPATQPVIAEANCDSESAEIALTARLLAGDLPRLAYRSAMATLAAKDAVRHPTAMPPDQNP